MFYVEHLNKVRFQVENNQHKTPLNTLKKRSTWNNQVGVERQKSSRLRTYYLILLKTEQGG